MTYEEDMKTCMAIAEYIGKATTADEAIKNISKLKIYGNKKIGMKIAEKIYNDYCKRKNGKKRGGSSKKKNKKNSSSKKKCNK